MNVTDAITNRSSVRKYKKEPVSQELLEKVLTLASRAISAENSQPWEFTVATGDVLERIRQDNIRTYDADQPIDIPSLVLKDIYKDRAREIGFALYSAMGIARDDRPKRKAWSQRGFRFFDAPAVIFLSLDNSLDIPTFRFDMGCVAQNICIAAMEYGLSTCVELQAVMYQETLRRNLQIPDNKTLICGIAIGYPDEDFPANRVRSTRVSLETNTKWFGF